jgi:transcription elongation factor Elf1
MVNSESHPSEEEPNDGPDCPDCGATTEAWVKVLDETSNEHSWIVDCSECEFIIETESNQRWKDRPERWAEEMESDLGPGDIR